jgi:hypothetical protein
MNQKQNREAIDKVLLKDSKLKAEMAMRKNEDLKKKTRKRKNND